MKDQRERFALKQLNGQAVQVQRWSLWGSSLLGTVAGTLAVVGYQIWPLIHSTFISTLLAGMVVVVAAFVTARIPWGDWRSGLRLSLKVFLTQTTMYAATLLLVATAALSPDLGLLSVPWQLPVGRLLVPLYGSSLLAAVSSAPMYVPWLPGGPNQ